MADFRAAAIVLITRWLCWKTSSSSCRPYRSGRPPGGTCRPRWFCLDSRARVAQAGNMLGPAGCAVVVPCFNEAASIAALVLEVPVTDSVHLYGVNGRRTVEQVCSLLALLDERPL